MATRNLLSSGYWGDLGSRFQSPFGSRRAGMGYPGDRARVAAGEAPIDITLQPRTHGQVPGFNSAGYFTPGSRFGAAGGAGRAGSDSEALYDRIEIMKDPGVAAGRNTLLGEFNQPPPNFDQLLADAREGQGMLKASFGREQAALNIDDYARRLRGLDDSLERRTGDYAGTGRGIGSRYESSDREFAGDIDRVTGRAYDLLPEYNRAAENIAANQEAQLAGRVSRYAIGKGGGTLGLGGDELRKIARGVADVRLPLERERIQREYDVLTGVDLPGQREIASREASRLSQFDLPLERDIYSQFYGTDLQRKNTENQIKQLEVTTAGMSRQSAEAYLRSLALPNELINAVLQRHNQTLQSRIQSLGGIGALGDAAYYRGLEYLPGSGPLAGQTYFNNLQPPYPSPQSTPLPTRTATNGGGGAAQNFSYYPQGGYGPGVAYNTAATGTDAYMTNLRNTGSTSLPNDYNWGRTPAQQAEFDRVAGSYQ